jgi:hypothetical protein
VAIKNGQSRETGNTGHTSIEAQNNTETKKMSEFPLKTGSHLNIQ